MDERGERDIFSDVAQRYDRVSRALTAGLDNVWRTRAVEEASGYRRAKVLDIATGTGTVAIMLARRYDNYDITGIDVNREMLSVARKKSERLGNINYLEGDVESLKLPTNSYDIVIAAFALGEFEDLDRALEQMHRVLKRNGKLILLDINKSRSHTLSWLMHFYRFFSLNLALDSRMRREVESYVNSSAAEADKELVLQLLKLRGFRNLKSKELSFRAVFVITANK